MPLSSNDTSVFDNGVAQPSSILQGFFSAMPGAGHYFPPDLPTTYADTTNSLAISYPLADATHRFQPPSSWGARRAPGEIQMALSDLLQNQGKLQQGIDDYNALIQKIEDSAVLLADHHGLNATNQQIQDASDQTVLELNVEIQAAKLEAAGFKWLVDSIKKEEDATVEAIPKVNGVGANDMTSVPRAAVKTTSNIALKVAQVGEVAAEGLADGAEAAVKSLQHQTATSIAQNNLNYEMQQQLLALEELLRQEPAARTECYTLRETVVQNVGCYQAAVAKGLSLLDERATFAKQSSADVQSYRYQLTFWQ